MEFDKLSSTLDLYVKSQKALGVSSKTVEKAMDGNAEALAVVRRAYNMEAKAVRETIDLQEKRALAVKKAAQAAKKQAEATALNTVRTNIQKSKLEEIDARLKKYKISLKEAGITQKVYNMALKGNAQALSLVSQATTVAIKRTNKLRRGFLNITGEEGFLLEALLLSVLNYCFFLLLWELQQN